MRTRLLMVVALGLAVPAWCPAQDVPVRPREGEFTCYPNHPGTWKRGVGVDGPGMKGLTPAQLRLFRSKMDSVAAVVRATAVFNPPVGFVANAWQDYCCTPQCKQSGTCGKRPAHGRLWLNLNYFLGVGRGPVTDGELRAEAELYFNDPDRIWNGDAGVVLPDGRKTLRQPEPWGKIGGLTLYHNQERGDLYAFFTSPRRGARPLWLPVSNEQYLEALLRPREEALANDLKTLPASFHEKLKQGYALMIDPPRAQLRGMSAAERAAPAWVGSGGLPVPANTADARPVVVFNPDYFDMSLPRTDIQLIVLRLEGIPLEGRKPGPQLQYCSDVSNERLWQFVEQMNWQAMARWMN